MRGVLIRILIAVVCVLFLYAILPPLLRVIGLVVDSDVMTIIRLCVAGLALGYIFWGHRIFGPPCD